MDHQRFDDLTRLFAGAPSRRRLLKGALAALAAGVFGGVAEMGDVEAASKSCRNRPNGTLCGQCGSCLAGSCLPNRSCGSSCLVCDPQSLTCKPKKCGKCGTCNERTGVCDANQSVCGACKRCNEVTTECVALADEDEVACGTCGVCLHGRCDRLPSKCGDDCGKCKKEGSVYNCKSRCRDGQRCCANNTCVDQDKCCLEEKTCVDGHCCPQDNTCTAGRVCCPRSREVCGNVIDAVCCLPGTTCASNEFAKKCCPTGETVLCGETCCADGSICCGGKCCKGSCSIGNVCCPTGSQFSAASDVCCPFGPPCGVTGAEKCCGEGETCCDGKCRTGKECVCPSGRFPCPNDGLCCGQNEACTFDGCCDAATSHWCCVNDDNTIDNCHGPCCNDVVETCCWNAVTQIAWCCPKGVGCVNTHDNTCCPADAPNAIPLDNEWYCCPNNYVIFPDDCTRNYVPGRPG